MKKALPVLFVLFVLSCKASPKPLWYFQTGGPVYGSPAIAGDLLLIGSSDHYLYALDPGTGREVWKKDLGARVLSRPLVDSGVIYIGNGSGDFFAVRLKDGDIQWRLKTGDLIHYDACMDQEAVYFGSRDKHFYKVSKSGQKIWAFQGNGQFKGDCTVYENLVLTSCMDQNFYGIERSSGTMGWKVHSAYPNFGGPEVFGNTVYFSTHDDIFRLEARTGKIMQQIPTSYIVYSIVFNNFLWTNEDGLRKRTLDGKSLGNVQFNSLTSFRPVIGDGFFIVGARRNEIFAVSSDLKILWTYRGKDRFWAPGVLRAGVYYTGNRDSRVYALRLPR